MLRKILLIDLLFILIYLGIGVMQDNSAFYLMFLVILCVMPPMSALAYDERAHWDRAGLCMPIQRHTMVLSKYALAIIGLSAAALPVILATAVRALFLGRTIIPDLQLCAILSAVGLLISAIQLPFLFWLGSEKGRIVTILLVMLGFSAPTILITMSGWEVGGAFLQFNSWLGSAWALPLGALALFAASACISVAIYRRKEIR